MDGSATATSGSSSSLIWFDRVKSMLSSGDIVEFSPKGHSMWPALRPGQDIISIRSADEYSRSDIVLALCDRPHGVFLHRIMKFQDGKVILMGDSNLYQIETCVPKNIVGKVVAISRNGHDISGSVTARLLSYVHRLPAPLRRLAVRILNLRKNGK